MNIGMEKVGRTTIVGNEARKSQFLKVLLQMLIGSAYVFSFLNFWLEKPLINILYNLIFGILFTIIYYLRNKNLELSISIGASLYIIFIFGHSYFLLPGKQLEAGLGVLTAISPIFITGFRLWFFFIVNLILYHFVLFSVGYENIFHFQYGFYVVIFVMINTILKENQQYEKELIIQRDKIKRDAATLREADELKTRFFANISHELRTPLTLILSPMNTILQSNELSNRNYTYLRLMQQNGQKLLKRINELLELSRLGAKKLKIEPLPTNIYNLTKQIAATYEGAANLKEIALDYVNDIDHEVILKLDSPKVEMIVTNYLSNAIKFTPQKGTITIHISKTDNQLQISVKDTGIGIPKTALDQVFNRFYQVEKENYHEGTGIGLALCKELAELHSGKVWVESTIGHGSTFFVQLPYIETFAKVKTETIEDVVELDFEEKEHSAFAPTKTALNIQRQTVLIVEDNKDLRQYIQLLLSEKYKVITAENGKKALSKLGINNEELEINEITSASSFITPNLIISDIMMPEMDGIELLKVLKGKDDFRHIPVILLTAQIQSNVKLDALRIGVDDYLTKPFQAEELIARVDNLIQNTQQRIQANLPKETPKNASTITAFDLKWLKEIEEKILAKIGDSDFKINDLAAEMTVSARTLQLRIKAITGLTPKKYQRSLILHHARKLLKSGDIKTISELSYQLGFEDQHYFSKLYKKEFGIMPKEELMSSGNY